MIRQPVQSGCENSAIILDPINPSYQAAVRWEEWQTMPDDNPSRSGSSTTPGANATLRTGQRSEVTAAVMMPEAVADLQALAALAVDWDGQGSPAPSSTARGVAHLLLDLAADQFQQVGAARLEPFAVAGMPGGGVFLEWRGPRVDLEVHIGPAGELGYLVEDRRAPEHRFHESDTASLSLILNQLADVLAP
jgi:hypothetical protein